MSYWHADTAKRLRVGHAFTAATFSIVFFLVATSTIRFKIYITLHYVENAKEFGLLGVAVFKGPSISIHNMVRKKSKKSLMTIST